MKRIVLSFVCVLVACYASHAQGVKFESGTWKEILTKAKTENKTIFVDVYTQWCGPCKHVSENVFPQEKLGEYYNSHFINFKIDAESSAGKEFVKTYPVTGYPTFFFIDGNGKVIHKMVGAKDANGFPAIQPFHPSRSTIIFVDLCRKSVVLPNSLKMFQDSPATLL